MTNIRTKRGALRRYAALYRQAEKQLAGGLCYGIDWPTLHICCPEIAAEMSAIKATFAALPE